MEDVQMEVRGRGQDVGRKVDRSVGRRWEGDVDIQANR